MRLPEQLARECRAGIGRVRPGPVHPRRGKPGSRIRTCSEPEGDSAPNEFGVEGSVKPKPSGSSNGLQAQKSLAESLGKFGGKFGFLAQSRLKSLGVKKTERTECRCVNH